MLRLGDTIEYLVDVSSPPNQKGIRGQTKIIDREIPLWTARFLLRGGKVRLYDPASPLQLEEEETEKSPDGSAEVPGPGAPGPDTEAGTKAKSATADKKERRTKTNGQRKSTNKRNQTGDHGPKKPDPQRRGGSGGG